LAKLPKADREWAGSLLKVAHQLRPFVKAATSPLPPELEGDVTGQHGQAYVLLADLEIRLHGYIISKLREEYGEDEKEWWVQNVPKDIREECGKRRGEDPKRLHDWLYLTLGDLGKVVGYRNNWKLFSPDLAKLNWEEEFSQKLWEQRVSRLTALRNEVMHPLRRESWDASDFQFVRSWLEHLYRLES